MLDESFLDSFKSLQDVGLPVPNKHKVPYKFSPLGVTVLEVIEHELHMTSQPYGVFLSRFPEYNTGIEKIDRWFIASGLDRSNAKPILRRMVAFIHEKSGHQTSFASIFSALTDFPIWLTGYFPAAKNALLRQGLIAKLYS